LNAVLQLFHLAANACGTSTGVLPSLYDNIPCTGGNTPEITTISQLAVLIANVVRILVAVSGSLAIITILVAAIYYIISAGDPARVKKAKDILVNTVTGLVLIIMSYAAVTFIAGNF
jgi:hypothetical protein